MPGLYSTDDKKDSHMMYMTQTVMQRARATGIFAIGGRAYKETMKKYEASTDKYHTDRRLVKAMAAKAYNYLSLVLALQNVGYYGAEFNKHAAVLYAEGTVQP
eukprot:11902542-Karenia_brevis.AAC.1